jgi:hypothetical protein
MLTKRKCFQCLNVILIGADDNSEDLELYSDDDEDQASIYDNPPRGRYRNRQNKSITQGPFLNFQR